MNQILKDIGNDVRRIKELEEENRVLKEKLKQVRKANGTLSVKIVHYRKNLQLAAKEMQEVRKMAFSVERTLRIYSELGDRVINESTVEEGSGE